MSDTMKNAFEAMNRICSELPYTVEERYYEMLDRISIAIVDYRVEHGLSQKQLAKQIGVSQPMISKYESGDNNISLKAFMELFDKLGIPMNIKIGSEEEHIEADKEIMDSESYQYRKMPPTTTSAEYSGQTPSDAA